MLEQAYRDRANDLLCVKTEPNFREYHSDSHFRGLLRRTKLPFSEGFSARVSGWPTAMPTKNKMEEHVDGDTTDSSYTVRELIWYGQTSTNHENNAHG